jgi:hypothetical protein
MQSQATTTKTFLALPTLLTHQSRAAKIVQAALLEDLRARLEPHWLRDAHAILGQQLGRENAQRAQQSPARVDHLDLTVARKRLGIRRQAHSVPAVVTGELAGQVGGGGALREGTCAR